MADEGYKIQVSVKLGTTMVNVRADDADEFALQMKALTESEDEVNQAIAEAVKDGLDVRPPKKKSSSKKSKSKSKKDEDEDEEEEEEEEEEDDEEEEDAPTKAQLARAKKLGIKGAKDMTADELKKKIKAKVKKK